MRWLAAVAVAIAAVVAVNVLLLGYGGTRHDPVGKLSPVAELPVPGSTTPGTELPTTPTTTERDDDADD